MYSTIVDRNGLVNAQIQLLNFIISLDLKCVYVLCPWHLDFLSKQNNHLFEIFSDFFFVIAGNIVAT